jgi:hypothetical protein
MPAKLARVGTGMAGLPTRLASWPGRAALLAELKQKSSILAALLAPPARTIGCQKSAPFPSWPGVSGHLISLLVMARLVRAI